MLIFLTKFTVISKIIIIIINPNPNFKAWLNIQIKLRNL